MGNVMDYHLTCIPSLSYASCCVLPPLEEVHRSSASLSRAGLHCLRCIAAVVQAQNWQPRPEPAK